MERERFHELVDEALAGLPPELGEKLQNIAVMVADWPTHDQMGKLGIKRRQNLLGLYEGVPLPNRGRGYTMVLPDRITIFQKPVEMQCHSDRAIVRQIQHTVRHEVAHYFGISDARLREMGRY